VFNAPINQAGSYQNEELITLRTSLSSCCGNVAMDLAVFLTAPERGQ